MLFFLELKLKGLTNIGPDPTDVIERNFREIDQENAKD